MKNFVLNPEVRHKWIAEAVRSRENCMLIVMIETTLQDQFAGTDPFILNTFSTISGEEPCAERRRCFGSGRGMSLMIIKKMNSQGFAFFQDPR